MQAADDWEELLVPEIDRQQAEGQPVAFRARAPVDGARQKNGPFKAFEERRVRCAFASMGECPVAVLWVRRSDQPAV